MADQDGRSISRARYTPTRAIRFAPAPRRRAWTSRSSPGHGHAASDDCGVALLGAEERPFWKDHKGARVNAIRNRTLIRRADIVIVRFGDKYRQWNAAFDAGYAAALDKPIITLHDPALTHALKEVDGAALAVAETPEQVVELLRYAMTGSLHSAA